MKVSEQKAQYEKLLSMSQHVIRECDAEAKRLRKIADIFRNMAEQYDAMAEETDKMKRAVPIADEDAIANLFCNEKSRKEREKTE